MSSVLAELDPFSPAEIARVSRRVTLPDGRGLGYAEFGPPDGPAVLYFHGWPSSRLEPAILGAGGVRIIAVDRPGYGLSDAVTGPRPRSLADWPADIVVVYLSNASALVSGGEAVVTTGRLEVGSWTDPETGFVSQIRIVDAVFGRG